MDEYFEYFLNGFGPAIDRREVPNSRIAQYRGRLPDQLLDYWQSHGWCGYANGLFWTVDPQEYESVLEAWIGNTSFMELDAFHVIARGAFGELYLFGAQTGRRLRIVAADANVILSKEGPPDLNFAIRIFFSSLSPESNDLSDVNGQTLFAPALEKFGRLAFDEMYGFVPALALGGSATLKHLEKVKAVEHLVLLAQLSELRVLNFPSI